jgi:hypothetical protein
MKLKALAVSLSMVATIAAAEPTHLMVRAQSLDAKFIGDQMGGVQVTLRDARTKRVLARGITKGGTGDTKRIMRTPRGRGVQISDASTAGFDAVVDIDTPTLIEAEGVGPLGKPASQVRVTSNLWVFPGRDISGDGLVLTFAGLVIEPDFALMVSRTPKLSAKVTLMCGCPIEPGGLWNADNYVLEAQLSRGRTVVARTPLAYAGTTSVFAGEFPATPPGDYRLRVTAVDKSTPNAGVWEGSVRVR